MKKPVNKVDKVKFLEKLKNLAMQRKAKEDKRPKSLSEEEIEENRVHWITFYRRNMNIYAQQRLGIKLHPFQHIMLYLASVSKTFFAICSRGLSKSFVIGLLAVCKAMLFPYSEIVITASTIKEAKRMVEKKIEGELCHKLSPLLKYLCDNKLITFHYNEEEITIKFNFNGSWIMVAAATESARGK